ncbi:T9SS type A sorting domain-containing protein [bacterium SCSIO 12741]|nr:T9SS type A sorting domain-containing protein [bacterium SCSIO 12741]
MKNSNHFRKLKIACLSFGALVLSGNLIAQSTSPPDYKALAKSGMRIDSIHQVMENYYTTARAVDTSEGGYFNNYQRWHTFWSGRDGKDGNAFSTYSTYHHHEGGCIQEPPCNESNGLPVSWKSLGPDQGDIVSGVEQQALGIVSAIAMDPSNTNVGYVGTLSGGLWKSTNVQSTTPTWTNITDQMNLPSLGVLDVIIDPNNSNHLFAATGSTRKGYGTGVIETSDGGSTWFHTDLDFDPVNAAEHLKLFMDPGNSNILFTHTSTEVFRTADGGDSWPSLNLQAASGNPNIALRTMEYNLSNPNVVYVAGTEIWRVTGNNGSWTQLDVLPSFTVPTHPNGYSHMSHLVELSSMYNGCYALIKWIYDNGSGGTADLYEIKQFSELSGTWTSINMTTQFCEMFIVNPLNQNIMYMGDPPSRTVQKSHNAGQSFYNISHYWPNSPYNGVSTHADIRAMKLISASNSGFYDKLIVGNDGGALYTQGSTWNGTKHVVNWKNINGKGLAITEFFGIGSAKYDGDLIHGGAQDNGLLTYDAGEWDIDVVSDGYDAAADKNDPSIAYGQGNYPGNRKTSNRGQSWSFFNYPPFDNPNTPPNLSHPPYWNFETRPIVINESNQLYIGHHDVFRRDGSSWTPVSDFKQHNVVDGAQLIAVEISEKDPDWIYAAFRNPCWSNTASHKLFVTKNGGTTWKDITPAASSWLGITDIETDPDNEEHVWVTFNRIGDDGSGNGQNRVWYSFEGGDSWVDWSIGLPVFPCNTIVYQPGSNNLLYVGTDVGVYYRDASVSGSVWKCYNNDMPKVIVTDLEINECSQKLIAATFGRGLWESDLAITSAWSQQTLSTSTYTGMNHISDDLIIPNGVTVTVANGATLNIFPGRKIMIQPGGHLIVNGGTLTNNCGNLWGGIEVHGVKSQSQHPSGATYYQGRLTTSNGAVIEHAKEAVMVWKPGDWTSQGGIVTARETTFRNNWRSVAFMNYDNFVPGSPNLIQDNVSKFERCTFVHDAPLNASFNPTHMFTMWKVRGIKIYGCEFKYTYDPTFYTTAIYSLNSGFRIQDYCNALTLPCPAQNLIDCKFSNLSRGIVATGAAEYYPISIRSADFDGCRYGVITDGVYGARIIGNNFESDGKYILSGVYMQNSSAYVVENNHFEPTQTSDDFEYGIIVYNSGTDHNQVYDNEMNNVNVPILAFGNNHSWGNNSIYSGLKFLCNDMSNAHHADILIGSGNGASIAQGKIQSGSIVSAGNTFSTVTGGLINYENASSSGITGIYYHSNASGEEPTAVFNMLKVQSSGYTCPTKFGPDYTKLTTAELNAEKAGFIVQNTNFTNGLTSYNNSVDGGNQTGLISYMDNASNTDADVEARLLMDSPLSEKVMMHAILERELNNTSLYNVLMNNEHSGRNGVIISALEEKSVPMHETMISHIVTNGANIGNKDEDELQLGDILGERGDRYAKVLDHYLIMESTNDKTDLVDWIEELETEHHGKIRQIYAMSSFDTPANVSAELTAWGNVSYTDDEHIAERSKLTSFVNLYHTYMNNSGSVEWPTNPAFFSSLAMISEEANAYTSSQAENILRFNSLDVYFPVLPPSAKGSGDAAIVKYLTTSSGQPMVVESEEASFKLYPNPSDGNFRVQWDGNPVEEEITVTVYNLVSTKLFESTLETDQLHFELPTGMYLVELSSGGQSLGIQKVNISH